MSTIAIVGGGPAGAMTAERLMQGCARANNGQNSVRVVVFEEKLGWEKPCGGGLSHKALRKYPFLLNAEGLANPIWKMEIRAPGDATVCLNLRQPLAIYSRRKLNHFLLQRSERAGAEVVKDRIIGLTREGKRWHLKGRAGTYESDYLIVAAGARSHLRDQLAGAFKAKDFMLTLGYYVPEREGLLRIEFFQDFEGYAWSFPRSDHLSVGICGKVGHAKMADLRQRLSMFMGRHGYSISAASLFSHLIPSLEVESWSGIRLEGPGWALVGDVSGIVDPVTGEGIYFGLRSAELLADSILNGSSYTQKVWDEFGAKLMLGARLCQKFYCGKFLGAGVATRMIQFCNRSKSFLNLFQDLIEGSQPYGGLRTRLYRSLPKFLSEAATQALRKRMRNQPAR
ncbi:MAG: NAD(P)/FAD-dependent oxidoreductase [Acidobacteriota bacterium]